MLVYLEGQCRHQCQPPLRPDLAAVDGQVALACSSPAVVVPLAVACSSPSKMLAIFLAVFRCAVAASCCAGAGMAAIRCALRAMNCAVWAASARRTLARRLVPVGKGQCRSPWEKRPTVGPIQEVPWQAAESGGRLHALPIGSAAASLSSSWTCVEGLPITIQHITTQYDTFGNIQYNTMQLNSCIWLYSSLIAHCIVSNCVVLC